MSALGRRGQTGLELIVGILVILMAFSVTVLLAVERTSESARVKTYLDAQRVGTSIKDNADMITQQGPGYYSYFWVPSRIHGGYDYDVHVNSNVLELSWADTVWSTYLLSANVTVHCLSKGGDTRNRVFYDEGALHIYCHLPNLRVRDSYLGVDGNDSWVSIVNDAHVASTPSHVLFETNGSTQNASLTALGAGQSQTLWFNLTGLEPEYATVYVDFEDAVNESVEYDNNMTWTL